MAQYFSIIKDGALFTTREATNFVDKTTQDLIAALKLGDVVLFTQKENYIMPLTLNEKPLRRHKEMIGNRPTNITEAKNALLVKDKSFAGKFAIFVNCETQVEDKIPKFPIWIEQKTYKQLKLKELYELTEKGIDLPHTDGVLYCNNRKCSETDYMESIINQAKQGKLLYKCVLGEKALFKIRMRKKIFSEIISTEATYINDLNTLLNYFKPTIEKQKLLSQQDMDTIFREIGSILSCHAHFFASISARGAGYDAVGADCLVEFSKFFMLSTNYIGNYSRIAKIAGQIPIEKMNEIVSKCPLNESGRNFQSYLITPVQRLPRYVLFIKELIKMSPKSHPDSEALNVAYTKIDTITREIQEKASKVERMSYMFDLQDRLNTPMKIYNEDRYLMNDSDVTFPEMSNCTGSVILFNDLILVTAKAKNGKETVLVNQNPLTVYYEMHSSDDVISFVTTSSITCVSFGGKNKKDVFLRKMKEVRDELFEKYEKKDTAILWEEVITSTYPVPSVGCCSQVFDGSIYFIGGCTTNKKKTIVDAVPAVFNPSSTSYKTLSELQLSYTGGSLVSIDNKLIFFGGIDHKTNKICDEVLVYTKESGQWTPLDTSMSIEKIGARAFHSALMFNNWMFVFGGVNGKNECRNEVFFLDVNNNMWIPQKIKNNTIPPPRRFHSACIYRNIIIIHGGTDGVTTYNDIWAFNLSKFVWVQLEVKNKVPIPERAHHSAFVVGHYMFVVGGEATDDVKLTSFVYDITNGNVEMLNNIGNPIDAIDFSLCVKENTAYAYGGCSRITGKDLCSITSVKIPDRFLVPDGIPEDQDPDLTKIAKNISQVNM